MREIDNKQMNNVNFKGLQKPVNDSQVPEETPTVSQSEAKEIKDLANMPAAALGKSQVASDSVENDMKILLKNPKFVEQLNKAVDSYAQDHTEEETLKLIEKMHQEFVAKK